jgi:hypothetical protein
VTGVAKLVGMRSRAIRRGTATQCSIGFQPSLYREITAHGPVKSGDDMGVAQSRRSIGAGHGLEAYATFVDWASSVNSIEAEVPLKLKFRSLGIVLVVVLVLGTLVFCPWKPRLS